MKIKVNKIKLIDCIIIIITIIDTEKIFSNKLFKNSIDYPSDEKWIFVEDKNNINWIEFITFSEEKAQQWADEEIKCLKDKLNI